MTEREIEEMAANLKAVTDRLTILDAIIKSEKLGQPKVMAFRCAHSGKLFAGDYAKEWGRTTGIGLGPDVCSETLDSMYHVTPPSVDRVRRVEDVMHPAQVTKAQLDLVLVPVEEFDANQLILHRDDEDFAKRSRILRANQIRNPRSMMAAFAAEFTMRQKGQA